MMMKSACKVISGEYESFSLSESWAMNPNESEQKILAAALDVINSPSEIKDDATNELETAGNTVADPSNVQV